MSETPTLHAVPTEAPEASVPAPVSHIGAMPAPVQAPSFGGLPPVAVHAFAIVGAAAGGAAIGGLAARSWEGAALGALSNLTLLGFVAALFGGDRLTQPLRIGYGGIALVSTVVSGYLLYRR